MPALEFELSNRIRSLENRVYNLERIELPVAGSGGFAPSNATYLTLSVNAGLTNERVFTPGTNLSGVDGGAGSAYTLNVTSAALTKVDDTNVTLTLGGSPGSALLNATSLTLGWNGLLGLSRGGTNANLSGTGGAGQYLKQSTIGGAITVGTIPASDIVSGAALTRVDDTNVTLTLGGNPATALLSATSLTLGWTGVLATSRGGTGAASLAAAGIVTGTGAATRVAFFLDANNLTTNANFIYTTASNQLSLTAGAATDTPLVITLAASHSANSFNIKDNTTANRFSVGNNGNIALTNYGAGGQITIRSANGSPGAETQILADDVLYSLVGQAWDNSSAFITLNQIRSVAETSITTSARDSSIRFIYVNDSGTVQQYHFFYRSGVISFGGLGVSNTNTVVDKLILDTRSTGTAAAGFGAATLYQLESSTTNSQSAARFSVLWATATHASRKARIIQTVYDTAEREVWRGEADGSNPMIGFLGATAVTRPTALTTTKTSITHTAPGTPDFAIQNLTNSSGYGFATQDEGNTVLSVILNLQTRVNELETKLQALGLLA